MDALIFVAALASAVIAALICAVAYLRFIEKGGRREEMRQAGLEAAVRRAQRDQGER
jgi:peptidoglycan/LPS O-acetylase OafA/YrhL